MKKTLPTSPRTGVAFTPVSLESLETRALLSFSFKFDYTYDTSGFFNTQARKDTLTAAANSIAKRIGDTFTAITPSGNNTWTANLINPTSGVTTALKDLTVPADTIIVYVGARDLPDVTLGQGGPSGWSASGTTDWLKTVRGRGNTGATDSPRTDFAPKVGGITFDTSTDFYFGANINGITSTQTDFYSVAAHELGHILGIGGGSETWPGYSVNGFFTGPKAMASYGGKVPLAPDGSHFAEGTMSAGQEVALDPTIKKGVRKDYTPLDFAVLDDIGYDIKAVGQINGSAFIDKDGDGYRDTGEAGISGVKVYIDANKNGVYEDTERSFTTGTDGKYYFPNLDAGTYRVRQVLPSGYTAVKPSLNYRDVTVTAGQTKNSQDFSDAQGSTPPPPPPGNGTITGNVFNDLNADSVKNTGEGNLSGFRVFIDKNKNGLYDSGETSALTDASGNYSFTAAAGSYRINVVTNSGYRRTLTPTYYDVSLTSGTTVSGKSFGFTQKVLLTGAVIDDANGNGVKDTGEVGLSSWRVFIDANKDGIWQSTEASALTDASGNWRISTLSAGSYVVRVVQQSGFVLTAPSAKYFSQTATAGQTKSYLNFLEK